jgi:hypothetical protein
MGIDETTREECHHEERMLAGTKNVHSSTGCKNTVKFRGEKEEGRGRLAD